ncbi:methionine biosynthesis PLP-dependent protein, partial [Staphylococcus chromogenes]
VEKNKRDIDAQLFRLTVGIKNDNDLEADIIQALAHSKLGVIS